MYIPAELGGLGAVELKNFLGTQCCNWLIRCHKHRIDNWRVDISRACPDSNLLLLRTCDIDKNLNPILYYMAKSYETFYGKFSKMDGNYRSAYVFRNPAFERNNVDNGTLDEYFFGLEFYRNHSHSIRNLKLNDFYRNGQMASRDALLAIGLPVSITLWLRLRAAGSLAWIRLKKNDETDTKVCTVEEFFHNYKRGSKKLKRVFESELQDDSNLQNLTVLTSFYNLVGSDPQPKKSIKNCFAAWRRATLQNNMREFLFKFRNNQLPLNNRVNAYDVTVDPRCSFCRIIDSRTVTRENFSHLFLTCPVTRILLDSFVRRLEPVPDIDTVFFKDMYWYGKLTDENFNEPQILFVMDCFRFVLWSFKTRRKIPNWPLFERELLFLIGTTASRNKNFSNKLHAVNMIANFMPAPG